MQAAQAAHAAFQFAVMFPGLTERWFKDSSYLILLSVPDRESLMELAHEVLDARVRAALWSEPDLNDEATALAIEPSPFNARLSSLPLLGKELAMS